MKSSSMLLLHKRAVKNYRNGEIAIRVDPGLSLVTYSEISDNQLVKLFRLFVLVYSFPLTIVGAVGASIIIGQYLYGAAYLTGLFIFIAIEAYVSRKITLSVALKRDDIFMRLHRKGVIKIITEPEL